MQHDQPAHIDIRISEIDREEKIICLNGRAEEKRREVPETEHQARKKPSTLMVNTLLAQTGLFDVAAVVEHPETLAVFQNPGLFGCRRGRENVKLICQTDDVIHEKWSTGVLQYRSAE